MLFLVKAIPTNLQFIQIVDSLVVVFFNNNKSSTIMRRSVFFKRLSVIALVYLGHNRCSIVRLRRR